MQSVKEISKQLKVVEVLSGAALPVSALALAVALAVPTGALVGVGAVGAMAAAGITLVGRFFLDKKRSEIRERIELLKKERTLSGEETSRLLSEVNRVTTAGPSG